MINDKRITLKLKGLAHDGRGIGFLPGHGRGKAVFVSHALPGDTASCRIDKDCGNFLQATALEIVDPGPNELSPKCPHSGICGGCALQRMPYRLQLSHKEQLIKDALGRIGKLNAQRLDEIFRPLEAAPELVAFRNKISLSFGCSEQGELTLGFNKLSSNEVFGPRNCILADSGAFKIARHIEKAANAMRKRSPGFSKNFWQQLVLRKTNIPGGNNYWLALLVTGPVSGQEKDHIRELGTETLAELGDCGAFIHEITTGGHARKRLLALKKDHSDNGGAARLEMWMGGRPFAIDAASFFQVNSSAAEILANLVREFDEACSHKAALLDLYCGAGAPGLLLSEKYPYGLGIERDRAAIEWARINAQKEKHWQFMQGDAGKPANAQKPGRKFSTALVDPPRSGLDRRIAQWLNRSNAENLIYISCNPSTLARDLQTLSQNWRLRQFGSVDMFPHSPHAECCVLLEKK